MCLVERAFLSSIAASIPVTRSVVALCTALLAGACLHPSPNVAAPHDYFERVGRAYAAARQADSAWNAGSFVLAGRLYSEVADDWIDPAGLHYASARAFARASDTASAGRELSAAVQRGFADSVAMNSDSALRALRSNAQWERLRARAAQNHVRQLRQLGDPNRARFVMSDIARFWRAYDRAAQESTAAARAAVYRKEYFNGGSPGLVDYFILKIRTVESFGLTIDRHPRYYASIRPHTLTIESQGPVLREIFRRMKLLYKDAVLPDVYFVIGRLSSAGTTSRRGLLLGIEQATAAPESPRDELNPTVAAWVRGVDQIPPIVAHELAHFQQHSGPRSLLRGALVEGGADFIGELISGRHTNPAAHVFGAAHEADVWRRFSSEMRGTDERNWIANGGSDRVSAAWVADLGYYVGYQIAKAYYERVDDKRQAVRDLLELRDPDAILNISGYASRFVPSR